MTELQPGETLKDTGWKVRPSSQVEFAREGKVYNEPQLKDCMAQGAKGSGNYIKHASDHNSASYGVRLEHRDVKRWKMAWRIKAAMPGELAFLKPQNTYTKWFRYRTHDFPEITDIFDSFGIGFGFSAAAFVYGGLHALAWQAHFQTYTQRLLWRISSCIVMGGIPTMCTLWAISVTLALKFENHRDLNLDIFSRLILVLIVAYLLARAYLVVECFIQLFNLPAGVFDVPQWTAYFPHIS